MKQLAEEELLTLWNRVYNIALGMLHNPHDAEDASQEIILKIHEHLSSFRGESTLETWAFRIARNHILNRKEKQRKEPISFELFEEDVTHFQPYAGELGLSPEEEKIYAEEVKVGCTTAMLQCLEEGSRFVFILGSIFAFRAEEAAAICGMSETAFRQNLSRARKKIGNFMKRNCGLLNPNACCRCRMRLKIAVDRKRLDPEKLLYRSKNPKIKNYLATLNQADSLSSVFRENPYFLRYRNIRESLNGRDLREKGIPTPTP